MGDLLPVSKFVDCPDGTWPLGTAAYEKRGVATFVPEWNPENCIQCNRCSYVCPHASIRPFVLTSEEAAKAPFGEEHSIPAIGKEFVSGSRFVQQVDVLDCLGCGNCVDVCPGKEATKLSRCARYRRRKPRTRTGDEIDQECHQQGRQG